MNFSYQGNRPRLILVKTGQNENMNAKWKLRHEEMVSDKASDELRAHFERKKDKY